MSQLIHMRQRIKAIGTIKKITSAMRLISRSFHTRMYREQVNYKEYQEALSRIFKSVLIQAPAELTPTFSSEEACPTQELLIIIGSQKGLCGSFNAPVFYWIDTHKKDLVSGRYRIIAMGKRVTEHLKKIGVHTLETLPELKLTTINSLTQDLFKLITHQKPGTRVSTLSCFSKTLFSQECKEQVLMPFTLPQADNTTHSSFDYVWSHDPEQIINTLVTMHITEKLRTTLFSSLLAEHNARFTAMDNATRNAENFLDTMKLQFNKMRQAKITKELAELAGAFDTQGMI
jgi:F-type H+-transporting ATPase subunit gamma